MRSCGLMLQSKNSFRSKRQDVCFRCVTLPRASVGKLRQEKDLDLHPLPRMGTGGNISLDGFDKFRLTIELHQRWANYSLQQNPAALCFLYSTRANNGFYRPTFATDLMMGHAEAQLNEVWPSPKKDYSLFISRPASPERHI